MRTNMVLAVGVAAVLAIGGGVLLNNSSQRAQTDTPAADQATVAGPEAKPKNPNVITPNKKPETIELTYYVLHDTDTDTLLAPRTVPLVVQGTPAPWRVAHTALKAMGKFPRTDGADRSPIPEGGQILGVHIAQNGIATVNLSEAFRDNFNGGAREEQMTLYAIVNTVGRTPGVKGVLFQVNGKKVDEFAGHIDLTDPLTPDESIVEKQK